MDKLFFQLQEKFNKISITTKVIILIFFQIFLLLANGYLLYDFMNHTKKDAQIINENGIIRGSIQKAVKLELHGLNADKEIHIIDNLLQKYSQNDPQLSQQIIQNWKQIQILIDNYRQTKNPSWKDALIEQSEKSWQYSNQMVDLMQFEAEKKHTLFSNLYYILIISFIVMVITLLIIFSIFRLKLEEQAKIDPLTKIYNRHVFYQQIQSKISSSKRYNYPLSIILFDIDFFKQINDTFGHDKGDEILISFAKLLQSQIRDEDILCRFGGEEFIIIAPYTDTKAAKELAHRLKNSIEQEDFDIHGTLTASIGIATKQDEDTEETLFKRADTALYISKENGRNRITAV